MRLRLEGVSHSYGDLVVLDDVSIEVRPNEIVCLVGPSGCGKSTLLRIAGGLERPEAGQVMQIGEPPVDCLNPLTYVFQDFALLPWRSVSGNVALPLEEHGFERGVRRAIVNDVLMRTGLSAFAEAMPHQLSGGMRQRVAIARALAVNPAVLLMDEPLSALDAQTRELLMEDLVGLWQRQPFTALYVTHNLAEAVRLGHRVVVLSRAPGRVREIVTIEVPLAERTRGHVELEAIHERLWQSVRDEARAADATLARDCGRSAGPTGPAAMRTPA